MRTGAISPGISCAIAPSVPCRHYRRWADAYRCADLPFSGLDVVAVAVCGAIHLRPHTQRSDVYGTHDETDLRLEVTRRETVADGVVALDLRNPFGADLPAWEPGAHIDVKLGSDLVRQYSLC